MSATRDSTLANPQELIADLQRQLAERTAERDEALTERAAIAEVLQVVNSSPGDLAPVFDTILEKAHALCGAANGVMAIREGEEFRTVAANGEPPFVEAMQHFGPMRPPEGTPPARLLRGERVVHLADFQAEDFFQNARPQLRRVSEIGSVRTTLFVPLRRDEEVLGFITAFRQEVRLFSDKEIALLENFAAQAVIAMENARLLTETGEALEQQTATAELLQVINSSPGDLSPVFEAILEKARILCSAAHGSLSLYDSERFRVVAMNTASQEFADRWRQGFLLSDFPHIKPLLEGARLVHVPDLSSPYGARTGLFVPLRKDDALLGLISTVRLEIKPFSDKEIALVENFAAQAVIAMENARLITETREALEQQTATAEVLGVINSSPGHLGPVFDAMLEKATGLCEADFGILLTYEEGGYRAAALRNVPPAYADALREPMRPGPKTALARVARGEAVAQIVDIAADEELLSEPMVRGALDIAGFRTVLAVPLRQEGKLIGAFTIYRQHVRPFTDKQIALLQNFAAQAVIAMENARLLTETREALEQQTATAEVLQVINSSPGDLQPVFDAILKKAHTLCGSSHGALFLRDGERFLPAAMSDVPELLAAPLRQGEMGFDAPLVRPLLAGEAFAHIKDLTLIDHPLTRAAVAMGVRTLLSVPLRKDGTLFGMINAARFEVRPFSDEQIALLQNFAAQAVIAMENARLLTETREALEQQTATAEVLGVINSSPGDLAPVFEAILEKAHTLCGAAHGDLMLYDGGYFRGVAFRGTPEPFAELLRQPLRPTDNHQRLLQGQRLIHFPDVTATERTGPIHRAAVHAGVRTLLMIPLRKDDALLGYITVRRLEVQPFTDKQIALLENFAAQAVIAIENARLLGELHQRTEEVAELNRGLEARVAEQVEELGRVGRLKRFLAPQLAEMIVSHGDEKILESHRREIVVVFCDLRGYTAFTETAEPEEVLEFLRQYHGALGPLVSQFEGTLDQFSGDGIMVFFNDPVPCPDPAERAVKMAMAMRDAAGDMIAAWRRRGRELGFGAGIAQGYATLGQIGFTDRSGYTAIGTVCNVAARLCAEAKDGQILLSQRVAVAVEGTATLEEIGALNLKGLTQPVVAYNVPLAATQPALRVIEGGPESIED